MCHLFCKSLGRGHIHVVKCESNDPNNCVHLANDDSRRHESKKYGPNFDVPKDEITHKAYWTSIGFQDPSQQIDAENYEKCPAYCTAELHEKEGSQSFCILPIWHPSAETLIGTNRESGLVIDGHLFSCSHQVATHFVLCLDDSRSMSGRGVRGLFSNDTPGEGSPWQDLVTAVNSFVEKRKTESASDMLSVVIFNKVPCITAEYKPINEFNDMWLNFEGGDTDYNPALKMSKEIIGRHLHKHVKPVLISSCLMVAVLREIKKWKHLTKTTERMVWLSI